VKQADGTVRRYLPLVDEAGAGSVQAVLSSQSGLLAERVMYADAYGDAPRYLHGPVVDKIEVEPTRNGDGTVQKVVVRVHLSETVDATTVSSALRVTSLNAARAVVATAVGDVESNEATITMTINGTEWTSLTTAPDATELEIAVSDTLRAALWEGPVMPMPAWLLDGPGRASTTEFPVIQRERFASLAAFISTIPNGESQAETLLAINNLYLAAVSTSKSKLLTGFKASPFVEPRSGFVFVRARWYAPQDGTWLTDDPFGPVDSSNLYAAFACDPVNGFDPTGTLTGREAWAFTKAAGKTAAIGLGIAAAGAGAVALGVVSAPVLAAGAVVVGVGSVGYNAYQRYDSGVATSVSEAIGIGLGDTLGITAGFEAYQGEDLSGRLLNGEERAARWGTAAGAAITIAATPKVVSTVDSVLNPLGGLTFDGLFASEGSLLMEAMEPRFARPMFEDDLVLHIMKRDMSVPRTRGIGGAHDVNEFMKYSGEFDIVAESAHPTLRGVKEIEYRMAALDKAGQPTGAFQARTLRKTVFDPDVFSASKYLEMGWEAANDAARRNVLGREWTGQSRSGVTFRGYTSANGLIRSFFPN
jgi:RHS repeat-associated protein